MFSGMVTFWPLIIRVGGETPLFTKGKVLFALDKAKRAILDAGHAVICEGQLDTIACHSAGVRNVVAPQGTALTADHARILKRYVNEVVLCFDGDKAGRAASVRSLDECLPSGLAVKVASIPPPDDPDSYLRQHGVAAFREVLARAQGFFDYYLGQLVAANDLTSDRGRLAVVREMGEKVNRTANAVLIDTYAQRTASRLGVPAEAVRAEFRKIIPAAPRTFPPRPRPPGPTPGPAPTPPRAAVVAGDEDAAAHAAADAAAGEVPLEPTAVTDETEPVPEPEPEPSRPSQPEFWLLKFLLLADSEQLGWAAAHLDCEWISHPSVRQIAGLRLGQAGAENVADLAPLLDQLDGNSFARNLVTEAAMESRPVAELGVQLSEATRRLRDLWIDRRLAVLTGQLTDPAGPEADRLLVLQERQELRALKQQPLTALAGF